jgi:hypothetical protein
MYMYVWISKVKYFTGKYFTGKTWSEVTECLDKYFTGRVGVRVIRFTGKTDFTGK